MDGTWKTLDDSYEREAKKAGYDPDHIAVLLSQNVYEQSQGNDNIDGRTTYEITYENAWSSNALVLRSISVQVGERNINVSERIAAHINPAICGLISIFCSRYM